MLDEKIKEIYDNPKRALKNIISTYTLLKEDYISLNALLNIKDLSTYTFRLVIISEKLPVEGTKKFNAKLVKVVKEFSPHFKGESLKMYDIVDNKLCYCFGVRDYGKQFLLKKETE